MASGPGSILNFRIRSVSSVGGLIAATLFAATVSDSQKPGCFKPGCLQFYAGALFCALLLGPGCGGVQNVWGGGKRTREHALPKIFGPLQTRFWSALSWIFVQENKTLTPEGVENVPHEGGSKILFWRGVIREVFHPPLFSTPPWRPLICALLRSFADLRLRPFALICALLRVSAFRTTAFGNCREGGGGSEANFLEVCFGRNSVCKFAHQATSKGYTPRGSCNNTLLRRDLRRFSKSKRFLEEFLEGAGMGFQ